MSETAAQQETGKAPINALVPMIRVTDVERSAEFYRLLGFEIGNYVPREAPPMHWAWLYQPEAPNWKTGANLMLVRSEEVRGKEVRGEEARGNEVHGNDGLDHDLPLVLYLYAADLVALRQHLLHAGIKVGEIGYPEYLPKGEFETHDPDGYTVMLAQSYEKSP